MLTIEHTFRVMTYDMEERIAKEVQIAAGTDLSHREIWELGELTPIRARSAMTS